jgi:hypothetical protein
LPTAVLLFLYYCFPYCFYSQQVLAKSACCQESSIKQNTSHPTLLPKIMHVELSHLAAYITLTRNKPQVGMLAVTAPVILQTLCQATQSLQNPSVPPPIAAAAHFVTSVSLSCIKGVSGHSTISNSQTSQEMINYAATKKCSQARTYTAHYTQQKKQALSRPPTTQPHAVMHFCAGSMPTNASKVLHTRPDNCKPSMRLQQATRHLIPANMRITTGDLGCCKLSRYRSCSVVLVERFNHGHLHATNRHKV